jgi:hypothetical protein
MDNNHWFDALHEVLMREISRRTMCLPPVALAIGLRPTDTTLAARCRQKSDRCNSCSQCCSNRCRRGFCYPRRK